jgi:hypothetical protein
MRARSLVVFAIALLLAVPASAAKRPAATSPKQMKAIVHEWSKRLNAGDNDGVAHLFRLPAIIVQNYAFRFHTYAQLAEWHQLLPCSGHITSIVVKGRYATAVFRLGNRMGSPCDSPGALVAARFEIVGGKIVTWVQIPVPPKQTPDPNAI